MPSTNMRKIWLMARASNINTERGNTCFEDLKPRSKGMGKNFAMRKPLHTKSQWQRLCPSRKKSVSDQKKITDPKGTRLGPWHWLVFVCVFFCFGSGAQAKWCWQRNGWGVLSRQLNEGDLSEWEKACKCAQALRLPSSVFLCLYFFLILFDILSVISRPWLPATPPRVTACVVLGSGTALTFCTSAGFGLREMNRNELKCLGLSLGLDLNHHWSHVAAQLLKPLVPSRLIWIEWRRHFRSNTSQGHPNGAEGPQDVPDPEAATWSYKIHWTKRLISDIHLKSASTWNEASRQEHREGQDYGVPHEPPEGPKRY